MPINDYFPWIPRRLEELPGTPLQRMDKMFERFMNMMPHLSEGGFQPRINIREDDKEILISAEVPGIDEKDIEINLTGNGLYIRGERREEKRSGDKKDRLYVEQVYGSFERFIPIDSEIDRDNVDATFTRGILEIHLPKTESGRNERRRVEIRSGETRKAKSPETSSTGKTKKQSKR